MSSSRTPPADHAAIRAFGPGSRGRSRGIASIGLGALGVVIVLAGCGGSSPRPAADYLSLDNPKAKISRSVRAEERAAHEQVLASLHQSAESKAKYGGIPRFIPRQKLPDDRVITATPSRPVLAVQGDAVQLDAGTGSVLATAIGPQVPDRIQGSADLHTAAVFDLTFAKAHGTLPLNPTMFVVTDEQGQTLHPKVTVLGGGPLPAAVPAGKRLTLRLSTRLSVGDGKLYYAPSGSHYLAAWDFSVETD